MEETVYSVHIEGHRKLLAKDENEAKRKWIAYIKEHTEELFIQVSEEISKTQFID